jgi:hypothetical protein
MFVAFYPSLSLDIKFYENNDTHVKTGYKLWLPWISSQINVPLSRKAIKIIFELDNIGCNKSIGDFFVTWWPRHEWWNLEQKLRYEASRYLNII